MADAWYKIENEADVPSPALLVYPNRVRENVRRMKAIIGDINRLRPHVKTNKIPQVIQIQLEEGVTKFKCSTIAEAEMVAQCGAPDVLLAFPQVGPNAARLARLVAKFPDTRFSTTTDDEAQINALNAACKAEGVKLSVLLDIDNGMHRSGIEPGERAIALYETLAKQSNLIADGLHVYDGNLRDHDLAVRIENVNRAYQPVEAMLAEMKTRGLEVPRVVCGGTPTFPVHARRPDVECSPGTCVFWDINYSSILPDLDFLHAAVLLLRVISKPVGNRLCLDAGYKAVSPDRADLRLVLLDVNDVKVFNHSEEHWTIETPDAGKYQVGDVLYAVPFHICPTVALHRDVVIVEDGRATDRWQVVARDRMLTV